MIARDIICDIDHLGVFTILGHCVLCRRPLAGKAIDKRTLADTLKRFGFSTGFDPKAHVDAVFTQTPVTKAGEVKFDLERRKDMTAEALKGYVTEHYIKFINTSRQLTTMEQDMSQLGTQVKNFKAVLRVSRPPVHT